MSAGTARPAVSQSINHQQEPHKERQPHREGEQCE